MNSWSFVFAAYAVTAVATIGLLGWAWVSMRRAEHAAKAAEHQR